MRWIRDDLSTRDRRPVRLLATLLCASTWPSGCADTQNHFIPAEHAADAATSANDPEDNAGSQPVQADDATADPSPTDVGSGDPMAADSAPSTQVPADPVTPPDFDAGAAPAAEPAASGSGATVPLDPEDASAPDLDPPDSTPADGAVAPAVGPNAVETLKCSLQFSACVLRTQPFVDECIDDFATCGDVLLDAADGSPEATCAVQFTACVLDNPARSSACTEEYMRCGR